MPPEDSDRDWGQYRRYILEELRRINSAVQEITDKIERFRQDDIAQIRTDIALLKFQAALWGAGAGVLFSAVVTIVLKMLSK